MTTAQHLAEFEWDTTIPNEELGFTSTVLDIETNQDYVIRSGKIFEVGEWEDKGFSLNADEMQDAIKAFQPVPLDLQHTPTILDGKLGHLQSVWSAEGDKGSELHGQAMIPTWLDNLIEGGKVKVSCAWDMVNKKIDKLALVINPRIKDAVLMSAFSAAFTGVDADEDDEETIDFAGAALNSNNRKIVQAIHDHACTMGAGCDPANMSDDAKKQIAQEYMSKKYGMMSFSDYEEKQNKTGVKQIMDINNTQQQQQQQQQEMSPELEAKFAAQQAQLEKQERLLAQFAAEKRHTQAEKIYSDLLNQHFVFPSQRDGLVALFEQAALDDETQQGNKAEALALFGATKQQASRVNALKATLMASTPYTDLTVEQIASVEAADNRTIFSMTNAAKTTTTSSDPNKADPAKVADFLKLMNRS